MASIKASTVQFNAFASFALNDLPKTEGDTPFTSVFRVDCLFDSGKEAEGLFR